MSSSFPASSASSGGSPPASTAARSSSNSCVSVSANSNVSNPYKFSISIFVFPFVFEFPNALYRCSRQTGRKAENQTCVFRDLEELEGKKRDICEIGFRNAKSDFATQFENLIFLDNLFQAADGNLELFGGTFLIATALLQHLRRSLAAVICCGADRFGFECDGLRCRFWLC